MSVTFEPNLGMEFWLAQPEQLICGGPSDSPILSFINPETAEGTTLHWRSVITTREQFTALAEWHCEDCRVYGPQVRREEPEGYKAINLNNRNASLLLQVLGFAKLDEHGYPELTGMIPVDRLEEHLLLADAMDLAERSTPDADSAEYFATRFGHLRELIESARALGADEITYA